MSTATSATGHAYIDAFFIVIISVVISLSVLIVVRRLVPHHVLMPHNDVAGFVYATIGVAYAVVLGFILIATWEQYEDARVNSDHEADALSDLYRLSEGLPDGSRQAIQSSISDYAYIVVTEEWPAMEDRTDPNPEAEAAFDQIWQSFRTVTPQNQTQQAIYEESLTRLNNFSNFRHLRLVDSRGGILSVMWFVLLSGATLTVLFPCVFGVKDGRIHALVITALAVSLGLLLFLTYDLNHPFQGDIHVEPEGFNLLLEDIRPAT